MKKVKIKSGILRHINNNTVFKEGGRQMYENKVGFLDGALATVKKNQMQDTIGQIQKSGRLI